MNNVFKFGYIKGSGIYKLKWLPHNIKQFFRNFRYAWQRATKGCCQYDLWSLDEFYTNLFIQSLTDFVNSDLHGAPYEFYNEETGSIEAWRDHLKEIIQHFQNSKENFEELDEEIGTVESWENLSEEKRQERVNKLIKLDRWREKELKTALDMLKEVYFGLWD